MTNLIKKIYEKLPKSIKYIFSKFFINAMIKHPEFKKTWKELDEFEKLSNEEQKQIQLKKLKEILIYSYENVPYYKELFDNKKLNPYKIKDFKDIEVLPILEKEEVVKLENKIYSTDKKLKYYKTFTGGSSGQSLTVLLDKDSIYKERAFVTHFLSKFGYDVSKTKTVALRGHDKDKFYYFSPLKNEIDISPFRLIKSENLDSICNDINKFGATFLMGYPSAIYLFAQMAKQEEKEIKIEHIVYYSENCSYEEKRYIEKVFGCEVDTYYGHTERACFAEIINGNCYFNDCYGYTELIPTDIKNEFRIVCTGFISRKMPLIRYATDDIIKIHNDGKIQLIGHRGNETYLLSKTNKKITKVDLYMSIEELKKIKCYQCVQNQVGKVEFHILPNTILTNKELEKIKEYIERRCENMLDVEIIIVDEIKLTNRGKYIWAINNIKERND